MTKGRNFGETLLGLMAASKLGLAELPPPGETKLAFSVTIDGKRFGPWDDRYKATILAECLQADSYEIFEVIIDHNGFVVGENRNYE